MIWLPTLQDVLLFHDKIITQTGGSHGVRCIGLIESALARAHAGFGDIELYPSIISKASATGCGLIQNHGFIDGNKRIGVAVLLLILRRNGISLRYTQEELVKLGLDIAEGSIDVAQVQLWLELHLL